MSDGIETIIYFHLVIKFHNTLNFVELQSVIGSETPQQSMRTQGMITNTKVKILPAEGLAADSLGDWKRLLHCCIKNGNLTQDLNKAITQITYTHFDKPSTITFSNGNRIQHSYTAGG